ncbi:FtsX-like permease family protein [Amycolatopsis acidicola]|uniref:FtsX-like permease family protein n=1 Tax=Amycolatopsis acidicola TaxID=2596893 RepID=A0A5N0V036_9PSEU|nr:ABC transporter permease [Amycolatopsis acidicola]KAA9157113.1 FtsX-like permease family protein [Amycolatopsis acidicola]
MNFLETLRFAAAGLSANKMRSALTTLGITIGVGAVILLVAVGNGASASVSQSIQGLGTNVLTVSQSRGGAMGSVTTSLTKQDAEAIVDPVGAPDVEAASPVASTSVTATYERTTYSVSVVGTDPDYFETENYELSQGSLFTDSDNTVARKVVVLGSSAAEGIFGTANAAVGKQVLLDGIQFTVVGVLKSEGTSGSSDNDDTAIAPLSSVQASLTGYGSINQIVVRSPQVSLAESEIYAILDARHGIKDTSNRDYQISSATQLLEASSETDDTFTVLLAAVAGISLLVGGIGVTNIMLVTVTERIREIGIRKALGAPRWAILGQFLAEATMLSLLGGVLGVAAGVIGSRFTIVGITPVLVPSSIVLAFAVSVLIGLFFGSYPANRAASLRPIAALRHE